MTLAAATSTRRFKGKVLAISSNYAAAYAAKDADVDVVSAYPITPQTHVVEKIGEFLANGEMDAEMIHVESEHSALSAAIGASATGARAFTATASQGLALMHEILHIASGIRLPIVMAIATRALSAPISIWNDYSDVMNARDAGWIIMFASSAQMVYDSILQAYKIAEDPRVHLPVMVVYDGYIMSHTVEPVEVFDKEDVLKYIPKNPTWIRLDPDNPVTIGTITSPDWYYEFKYQQVMAMKNALQVAREADKQYGEMFGRSYGLIGKHMLDDADVAIVTMGAFVNTAIAAAMEARKKGIKAGVMELRLYRPFPMEDIEEALSNVKAVGIVDKAISYGAQQAGPVFNEFAGAYYSRENKPLLVSFIAGIGQRAVFVKDFLDMFEQLSEVAEKGKAPLESIYIGVRA